MTKKVWNMSKINLSSFPLKYPEKEKAYAFVNEESRPFHNVVIGITNPTPYYEVSYETGTPVNGFEYVLEGEGEILVDGVWHKVHAGQVYILRQGELHRYRADPSNPWKKLWINYVADYISPLLDAYGIKSGVYSSERAKMYFERALEFAEGETWSSDFSYNVADCVHRIISAVALEKNDDVSYEYRIREAINSYVYEKLNLDELSERLHMSKSNVIRIFKKEYGTTPYEYLISLKISTAKILLKDTQMTVREIAERLCFSDEHYFSNIFFARVGVRPREYRQRRAYRPN